MTEPILEVVDLSVSYRMPGKGEIRAVEGLSLAISSGETLGVVGESGSGKSTLASAILRLLPSNGSITGGQVIFQGTNLLLLSQEEMRQFRWKAIAVVFQKSMNALSPVHRIDEQFFDVIRVHQPSITREEFMSLAKRLLARVGLRESALQSYPHELSGGMLQRLMIALSLIHNPKLLILDEATTALDVVTQGQILREFKKLREEFSLTTIVITHDISVVAELCDKVAVMYAGQLMELGKIERILTRPDHPYTQALLASFPRLEGPRSRIEGIPGALPDLSQPRLGCVFAERCPRVLPQCQVQSPPNYHLEPDHIVKCHLAGRERTNV